MASEMLEILYTLTRLIAWEDWLRGSVCVQGPLLQIRNFDGNLRTTANVQTSDFRGWTASNVENYPFRQKLQLPSSGWICNGWAFLEALYRQLQCLPKRWIIFNIRRPLSQKAEVVHRTQAAKTQGQEWLEMQGVHKLADDLRNLTKKLLFELLWPHVWLL
jgi:hypothetical protein